MLTRATPPASDVPPVAIARGLVRHHRLRPAGNAFSYAVQFLRLRIDTLEPRDLPWLLSRNRFNLFALYDRDYGFDQLPLLDHVRRLLADQHITDADGAIWLHTFPRVLGFVFNPVSFWFCHRADGALRAILCEVNNTFGERHCYVLAHEDGDMLRSGETLHAAKRFHVSPFCPVSGDYRFRFCNQTAPGSGRVERCVARIDYADDGGPILLTSVSGRFSAATNRRLLAAFARMPWMTIGVVARIHWQALKLWIKRVPLVRKPTPPATPITRSN